MKTALIAIGIGVGGIVLGSIAASIVRRWLEARPQPVLRDAAKSASSLVFGIFVAGGLIGALGVASPESLKPLPTDFARWVPNAVVAALLIIGGQIAAQIVGAAAGKTMLKATGKQPVAAVRAIEIGIITMVGLLAARQLGLDTTVLNIMLAAVAFGGALAMALLVGVGGRDIAKEIAAGRALMKVVQVGDTVHCGDIGGIVQNLLPTVTVLKNDVGLVSVSNSTLQTGPLRISQIPRDE